MDSRISYFAAALLALTGAGDARAAEPKTWYVYCEGASADGHWAVFSENFWPHPETAGYGRQVGSAAKAFFEQRHDLPLEGCAGVNFRDDSLAEHSRSLTVQLHRRMGDRVYFLPLPAEILPAEILPTAATAASPPASGDGRVDQVASGQPVEVRGWVPFRPAR